MFSFLGGLMALMAWLIQQVHQSANGTSRSPRRRALLSISWDIGLCHSMRPTDAGGRLGIGPPRDWSAHLLGIHVRPTQLAMAVSPSRRSRRN